MANVENAYCAEADLRTGDLAPPSYTSKVQYIQNAAEEIDAAIGAIYVTPIEIPAQPEFRPSILFLKKVNWLLASGRLILDIAAAGEQDTLHAYGKSLLAEAVGMLEQLQAREIALVGATVIPSTNDEGRSTGPTIFNEDKESLVEGFYRNQRPGVLGIAAYRPPVVPYGP